jgi:hypothetical protein
MGKIIDVDKAQQALDRAARNARSGPADVRAGRFVLRDVETGRSKIEGENEGKVGSARGKT